MSYLPAIVAVVIGVVLLVVLLLVVSTRVRATSAWAENLRRGVTEATGALRADAETIRSRRRG